MQDQIEALLDGSGVAYQRRSAPVCQRCIKCKTSRSRECTDLSPILRTALAELRRLSGDTGLSIRAASSGGRQTGQSQCSAGPRSQQSQGWEISLASGCAAGATRAVLAAP